MSLRVTIETEFGHRIAFWELTESIAEAELLLEYTPSDRDEYDLLVHEKRRSEWLASRLALRNGLGERGEVNYHSTGQPYLPSVSLALSFSHCLPLAGVVVHPATAGIDIQRVDQKLLRIKEKFASHQELVDAKQSADELSYLTILWTIKEAIFKVYGSQLPFAEGIQVSRFELSPSTHAVHVIRLGQTKVHQVQTIKILDFWVAVVLV